MVVHTACVQGVGVGYLNLHRRRLQGPVHHGQHAALDGVRGRLGQQEVHLLQEDQQDLAAGSGQGGGHSIRHTVNTESIQWVMLKGSGRNDKGGLAGHLKGRLCRFNTLRLPLGVVLVSLIYFKQKQLAFKVVCLPTKHSDENV